MPDMEKVIKAWEIFRDSNPYEICDGREFRAIKEPEYCMGQMIEDTMALLKEQKQKIDVLEDQNARLIRLKEARFQPEIKWIPTSERLPEKSGQYLVMGEGKYWISELMILQPIGVKGWCSACGNPQIEAWAFIGRTPEEHETH